MYFSSSKINSGPLQVIKSAAVGLVIGLAAACAASGAEKEATAAPAVKAISYAFKPVLIGDKHAFHVTVRFRAADAVTSLVVPVRWGGAEHLENQTQDLKAVTPGAMLEADADPGRRNLHARAGEMVQIEYNIVPQQTEWFRHPQEHMAVVNDDYFLFNTDNALVYPSLPQSAMVEVTFDWRALPASMPLVSSFGVGKRLLRVREPWYRVDEAMFAGGNFRLTESTENGTRLVLAARGTWKFTDAEAFAKIRRVVDEENKFWKTKTMPFFLVTLASFDDQAGDNDGSAFTNAFMLFLSHEDTFDADRVRVLAHEMFHHWNPISMGPTGSDESAQWFSEGFTVYYEVVLSLRAGLISEADALANLNRRLVQYQASPLRHMPAAEWQKISHASGPGYELSYARGAAIAVWADAAIRERNGGKASLDSVMFELVKEAERPNPPELTDERIFAAFARFLAGEQVDQLRRMVVDGADVPLPARLGSCAELKQEKRTIVAPGFDDRKTIETKRVVGVELDGPAYRAGARDGQESFRVSVSHDDPSKEVLLGVVIDGKRETLHFSGAKDEEFAQYEAGGEECQEW
jgi:predicted metalloprotease with PDZ domain